MSTASFCDRCCVPLLPLIVVAAISGAVYGAAYFITEDQLLATGVVVGVVVFLIFLVCRCGHCLARLPCLDRWLLSMEVNNEANTVRNALEFALKEPLEQRSSVEAALDGATPGGPPVSAIVKDRTHELLSRQRPTLRGTPADVQAAAAAMGDSMAHNTSQLILAEAKAETSKADDARKVQDTLANAPSPSAARAPRPPRRAGAPRQPKVDKTGRATMVYPGDGVYEGAYTDGRKQGFGKFWYVDGTVYEGQWHEDQKSGEGKETYTDGAVYEGDFARGSRAGHGMLKYANNDAYEGEWQEDVKHGKGTFRWAAGTVYTGDFADGVMHGDGTYHFADGCTYQGQYEDGKRNGRGMYRFLDGSFFEGEYREGVVEGRGTFTFADGSAEVGRWEGGQPVGESTRFSPDHRNAWRLFDGQVTGPVSLDLADVIAQMAFRPKAARLARAVRDQLALVHLEDENKRFASPVSTVRPRSRSPSPVAERPPWQGPTDAVKRAQSPPATLPSQSGSADDTVAPPAVVYPTCNTPGFLQAHQAASSGEKGAPSPSLLRAMLPSSYRGGGSSRSKPAKGASSSAQAGAAGGTGGAYMC